MTDPPQIDTRLHYSTVIVRCQKRSDVNSAILGYIIDSPTQVSKAAPDGQVKHETLSPSFVQVTHPLVVAERAVRSKLRKTL